MEHNGLAVAGDVTPPTLEHYSMVGPLERARFVTWCMRMFIQRLAESLLFLPLSC